jgi:tryptophan synthase alpha chain
LARIDDIFSSLRQQGRKALMPFICGGYPDPKAWPRLLPELEQAGASIIEVGIPFSDPIADGSVIAAAMNQALRAGVTPWGLFEEVAHARASVSAGLVAMISVSLVHRAGGFRQFVPRARDAGFDGLIVPDCPIEESAELVDATASAGLCLSLLIAPSTPPKRAEQIVKACSGFVYLLARAGITGEQGDLPVIEGRVARLRQMTDLPIAVGFGISSPEHVRAVVRHADAAIVGSALVRHMAQAAAAGADPVPAAATFTRNLCSGLTGAGDTATMGGASPGALRSADQRP